MKWLVVILLITTSCGMDKAACGSLWFTTSGLKICDNNLIVISAEIDYLINVLEEEVNFLYPNVKNLYETFELNKVEVLFTNEGLATNCQEVNGEGVYYCDNLAYGVNLNGIRIYTNHHECLAFTAFTHELLHTIEYLYFKADITNHNTPGFFNEAVNAVNSRVKAKVDGCKGYR